MKKILYIEDELAENVKRILAIFESILGAKLSKELEMLDDPYDSTVREIVEQSQIIDVCYTFSDALKKVKENYQDYDMFIIDRDLSEDEYSEEEIRDISPEFTEDTHLKYLKREGDYLFSLLRGCKSINHDAMVYFLTANNDDSLKCQDEIAEPGLSYFIANNIKNKRNPEHIKQLTEIIKDFKKGNFRVKMKDVFEVFDKGLLPKDVEQQFIRTLQEMDSYDLTHIEDNLSRIRKIQEAVYNALSRYSEDIVPAHCAKNDKGDLAVRKVLKHLNGNLKYNSTIKRPEATTTIYQESLVRNFSESIYSISNDYGVHDQYEKFDLPASKYTVQALTHALCDLLLWFKDIVQK